MAFSAFKSIFEPSPKRFRRHRVARSFRRAKTPGVNSLCAASVRRFVYGAGIFRFLPCNGAFGDIVSLRVFAKQKLSGLHSLCAASVRRFYGAGTLALLRPAHFRLAKVLSLLARSIWRHRAAIHSLCAASVRGFFLSVFENHNHFKEDFSWQKLRNLSTTSA